MDQALVALELLCEKVDPPKSEQKYLQYFCGNTEIPTDLRDREAQRVALYRGIVALIRAFANIADELDSAGYSPADIDRIKQKQKYYLNIR